MGMTVATADDATNRAGGEQRRTCAFATPAGPVVVAVAAGAVVRVRLGAEVDTGGPLPALVSSLAAYLRGETPLLPELPWRLDGGTPFQRAVWRALGSIPVGATWPYRDLAAHLGRPGAARAVGQALSRNPLPVLLPCHRVVGAAGLGGFSCGPAWKRYLLRLEGAAVG